MLLQPAEEAERPRLSCASTCTSYSPLASTKKLEETDEGGENSETDSAGRLMMRQV